jgi:hypothetical protein
MATHRVFGLTAERASYVRKCPRCNEAPLESSGSISSSTVSGTSMSGERSTAAMLMDHIPRCPCSWYLIQLHDRSTGLSTCLKSSCLKRWLLRDVTCGWRSSVFGQELLHIVMGTWFGSTSWLRTVILYDGYKCSHQHQCSSYRCSSPTLGQPCIGSSTEQN